MIGMGTTIFLVNPVNFGGTPFANDYSLLFDGVDERLDMTNITELQNVQNFSISCWTKLNASGVSYIFGRYVGSNDAIFLSIDTAGTLTARVASGGSRQNTYSGTYNTGQWYHVAMVYDGTQSTDATKLKVYLDGSELTRTGGTTPIPTVTANTVDTFHFADIGTGGGYSNINVDEGAIFDYSLTSGQVTSIYNSGTPTDLDNTSGVTAPVHWWRMGDGATFSTNWTIPDIGTTGGNNGTSSNMEEIDRVCSMNPSIFCNDYSLLFDGVDEYVTTSNISALQNVSAFSYSTWIKLNDTSGHQLMGKEDGNIFFFVDPTTGYWRVRVRGALSYQNDFNDTISTGAWIHCCVVYDGPQSTDATKLKLYIDGSSLTRTGGVSPIPSVTSNTSSNFNIGTNASGSSFFSNAYIDESAIFDYALTSGQVTSIYNTGTPTDLDNTSGVTAPVHWWRMGDGDTFPTINDVGTTGGNNGTMTNMESGDINNDRPI